MLDNICNRLAQEVPGGAAAGQPESRELFVPMFTEVLISGNTTPHFSLLPLAVVRYVNPGSHDPGLIFFSNPKGGKMKS
jgi:hypothetical protein